MRGCHGGRFGGFLTNCCVESTMRSAYEKGFEVVTLTDCVGATSAEEHTNAITYDYPMFSKPMSASLAAVANTPAQQCDDARWLFDTIVNSSSDVTRFYMYQWRGDVFARSERGYSNLHAWDSGLVVARANPDQSTDFTPITDGSSTGERPIYQLFQAEIDGAPFAGG